MDGMEMTLIEQRWHDCKGILQKASLVRQARSTVRYWLYQGGAGSSWKKQLLPNNTPRLAALDGAIEERGQNFSNKPRK
jgi:hypothetical protein